MSGNKKFVIGLADKYDEYVIYYITDNSNELVYLRRYDNSNAAVEDLLRYSLIGTSDIIGSDIFNQIKMYIDGDINIHMFILSLFTTFRHDQNPELQNVMTIIDNIEATSIDIYRSILDHLTNCIYPDDNYLKKYVILYYIAESIIQSIDRNILYDHDGDLVKLFINQIMSIFDYTPEEVVEI